MKEAKITVCVWCNEELVFMRGRGWVHKKTGKLYAQGPEGKDDHCALPKAEEKTK